MNTQNTHRQRIAIIIAMVTMLTGCTSKSGRELESTTQKVDFMRKAVILEMRNDTIKGQRQTDIFINVARIKDIERGVIISRQLPVNSFYRVGDTILIR